uniref:Uncharacterized protein n=1 Tax=Amphimedon queenslandica TaxID=400682 RepID=A0A1X7TYC9_AMPQE
MRTSFHYWCSLLYDCPLFSLHSPPPFSPPKIRIKVSILHLLLTPESPRYVRYLN